MKWTYFLPNGIGELEMQDGVVVMGMQLLQFFKVACSCSPTASGVDSHGQVGLGTDRQHDVVDFRSRETAIRSALMRRSETIG